MTIFHCLRFATPLPWRARTPYLYPPGTGWPSYTPRHRVFFSSSPTTRRATVVVFEPASTRDTHGYEILTAVFIKSSIFWDIAPCSPLKVNRLFGVTCLHLHGWRISQVRNQREACSRILGQTVLPASYLLHTGFLLCLFFDTKDGGDMFLRNVGWLSVDYTALYPRRQNSSYSAHCKTRSMTSMAVLGLGSICYLISPVIEVSSF
jgi:hypothetical protein